MKIGTSGFSFPDWIGNVYPENTKKENMFSEYLKLGFDAVEINFTYYSMPYPKTMSALSQKTDQDFSFCVKLHKSFTHEYDQDLKSLYLKFLDGIRPLIEDKKFGCLIGQFPYSFKRSRESVEYLLKLKDIVDVPLVIEFRNDLWNDPEIFEMLVKHDISIIGVDLPKIRGLKMNEKPFGKISYFRFHGRNVNWFTDEMRRYDYMYSEEELFQLAKNVLDTPEPIYVFFNNCHNGQAAKNAIQFSAIIRKVRN
ncbi:MAG: DUF72 domain-containing protein [Mesoaciditoga sp.]|uniref:DUF72 domain-containing protein n=1 Tax=Athalassotoga sp. TaxID=2022597 RepID=UPI000CB00282|nr:MAG: DUF72 domain-containing protein [Mesoaciditoga sp.]HEU25112.1 DUF72 domain-containing protein [Mesoaciditoga lauensis]